VFRSEKSNCSVLNGKRSPHPPQVGALYLAENLTGFSLLCSTIHVKKLSDSPDLICEHMVEIKKKGV